MIETMPVVRDIEGLDGKPKLSFTVEKVTGDIMPWIGIHVPENGFTYTT